MAKRNWDRIKGQKPQDTVKYRDVYEDQQLERGDLDKRQTMTSRTILSVAVGLIVMLLVWIVISAIQMAMSGKGTLEMNPSPENTWIHVNEHYVNVNDQTDVISSDMYNALVQKHKDILSGKQEVVENPGNEPDLQAVRGYESSDWERKNEGYTLTVPVGAIMPDGSRCTTPTELFMSIDDYKAYAAKVSGDYQNRYNAYIEYQRALEDPANTYSAVVEHYRNRNDFSQYIKVDEYKKELNEFNAKKEKAKAGSSFADLCSVPFLPIDPSTIYTEYEHGNVDPYVYSPKLYLDEQQRNMFNEFVSQHRVESDANDIQYKIMDDTVCFNEYPSKDLIAIFDKLNALVGDRAISYKNTLDGTIISYEEYDEMMCKYQEDLATFKKEYKAHREKFHPDDIDGTAKVFDWGPNTLKFGLSFGLAMLIFSVLESVLYANLRAQNVMSDTTDINQYHNDQHIALPEEIQRAYDVFPDVGAHSAVQVSSMISHVALLNKGLKTVNFAERATKDIKNDNGDIEYYKGEILEDENGHPIVKPVSIIDNEFMEALFDASGAPKNKNIRKYYDATKIPYNPDGSNRDKLGKYATWADLINKDWEFPLYEPQRPAGAYIVDTAPVNTMVLAITRAGKGQTVIEPTIDMWMREKRQNNMVINDPKGELLVKNYVRGTVRGFQIVQFNLINAMKTDIYNPLAMAADAAREGDQTKCAMYVENIAEVFFPLDGGEDPVWPNAANNAFKRAAYGLIDYYLEEEKAMRRMAERTRIDDKVLEQKIDEMWGKVTLYNCYQLFVQLSSKKMKNPAIEFANQAKAGKYNDLSDAEYAIELEKVKNKAKLWEDKQDADLLTLYFSATDALPRNSMRTLVANANNALKAMGGADKMMASVYGIAITAMSFFTDPTISTLTSGTLNQNVDLGGLSFPRRFGVRFNSNYIEKYHFVGQQAIWTAYDDPEFRNNLGKDFYHEDMISREGWARYYFDGKFKNDVGYVKLEIKNPSSGALIRTFYFEFQKNYQTSLDGRVYAKDPILEKKIIKNGILTEMRKFKKKGKGGEPDKIVFRKAKTTFKEKRILDFKQKGQFTEVKTNAITSMMVRYAEKPKMIFLVTPPHLMKYAKLILILIKQLVDLNFDKSYMTKSNQKPLYKTRFMLDELGNLQSEGHGISGFQTMLSIGLGQEQQFTLILQTLQQLRNVYGEDVDKIVQGNAQPLTSHIATPIGWKLMKDIQVGDEVLTPNGTVTTVTGVYPKGVRPVYDVELRDGSHAEACNEHLWNTVRYKTSIKYSGKRDENGHRLYVGTGENGRTFTSVNEVINTDALKEYVDKNRQIYLPVIQPLAYSEKDLTIDPYVLGAILGDGHIQSNGVVKFTCADSEIVSEITRRGYEVVDDLVHGERRGGIGYRINGLGSRLKALGLSGLRSYEKFIPEVYLYGSVEQRIDLLRGLMDTDGTISTNSEIEFTSSSETLALNVQSLVRSLGGRVVINIKNNVMYTSPNQLTPKEARPAYRVQNIRLSGINPFLLSRKADRWFDRDDEFSRVVKVTYLRDDEVQCISVADESHLYITDDYIPTHNTSNIVFLKSTDDSMLETLSKMSGIRHKAYKESKTITQDQGSMVKMTKVEGKVSYTMTLKEEPVISYNDMAFISERNSIVFRAGDSPIWNRNETILPMSWRLFKNTITHPGKEYSLQTIPTLSTAMDFDVRKNQPNFRKMLEKRMEQAYVATEAQKEYQDAYGYSDYEIEQLDPDVYSDEIMDMICTALSPEEVKAAMSANADSLVEKDDNGEYQEMFDYMYGNQDKDSSKFTVEQDIYNEFAAIEENKEQQAAINEVAVKYGIKDAGKLRYAGCQISRDMIVSHTGISHSLDEAIIRVYKNIRGKMDADDEYFIARNGHLYGVDGKLYIKNLTSKDNLDQLNEDVQDENSRVFADGDLHKEDAKAIGSYEVRDAFLKFLCTFNGSWPFADGEFDVRMASEIKGE